MKKYLFPFLTEFGTVTKLFGVETNVQTIVVAIKAEKCGCGMEDQEKLFDSTFCVVFWRGSLSLLHHSLRWNIPNIFSPKLLWKLNIST